jgi:hypothetical protein
MKNRTEYVCRCEMCMQNITYVMRDEKLRINPTLTDDQVHVRLSSMQSVGPKRGSCENCDATTLQTFVGYRHV